MALVLSPRGLAIPATLLGWLLVLQAPPGLAQEPPKRWAIAEFGEPLYDESLEHWPYADPDRARKGGSVTLGAFGTFDTLNTFILRGTWPQGIGLISDSMMVGSGDELSSGYGLLAEWVQYPEDKSWAIFKLREGAYYHDGVAITAHDIEFAYDTIMDPAISRPFLRSFYEDVTSAEVLDDLTIRFEFRTRDSMKPIMNLASMAPLPRHFWDGEEFDIAEGTLAPILGSGPYRIAEIDPGRSITYQRVEDWWAEDLPISRGLYNVETITFDYYRDQEVVFEAFKAGEIDYREESRAQNWAIAYDEIAAIAEGTMVKEALPDPQPEGTQGFFFNLRRERFQDPRVREALIAMYDFEAIQRTLLYGQYKRARNFFLNSDFGHDGAPEGVELALLEPWRDQLPPELFEGRYQPPQTDGTGRNRAQVRAALGLLGEAGWEVRDGTLVNAGTGAPFRFEILLVSPQLVRLTQPYADALKRIGIDATVRVVDTAQFRERLDVYDFDAVSLKSNFFPPPGAELRSYYGSEAGKAEGSGNWSGIDSPVVDALIEEVVRATSEDELKAATRALDRVLSFGLYYVPHWYNDEIWIAYWDRFGRPERLPTYGTGFPTVWWVEPEKDRRIQALR